MEAHADPRICQLIQFYLSYPTHTQGVEVVAWFVEHRADLEVDYKDVE